MSVDFGVPSLYGFVSPWPMVVDSCRFIKLGDSLYFLMHNAMLLLGYIWQLKHMWNKTLEVNDYRSTNSWNIFFVLFNSVRKLGLSRTLTKISQGIYSVSSSDWNNNFTLWMKAQFLYRITTLIMSQCLRVDCYKMCDWQIH